MAQVWSERIGEEIEDFMRKSLSRFRDAVCPIFFTATNDSRSHCIVSGVLLRLAEHHFVLTAAHVTDQRQFGSLSLPGRHGNPGLSGHYAGMRLPCSGNRRDDRYDIAYIRLTADSAASFDNPDHVDIVIHNYRWRLGLAEGERKYDDLEKRLAEGPVIPVPAITLESDANGAPHPDPASYAKKFSGKFEHRNINGGVGHNLPQEAPQAFAKAVVDVDHF